jgi:hypothetical protein
VPAVLVATRSRPPAPLFWRSSLPPSHPIHVPGRARAGIGEASRHKASCHADPLRSDDYSCLSPCLTNLASGSNPASFLCGKKSQSAEECCPPSANMSRERPPVAVDVAPIRVLPAQEAIGLPLAGLDSDTSCWRHGCRANDQHVNQLLGPILQTNARASRSRRGYMLRT